MVLRPYDSEPASESRFRIIKAPAAWTWTVPRHHSSLCVLKSVAHWAVLRFRSHLENELRVLETTDNRPPHVHEDNLRNRGVIEQCSIVHLCQNNGLTAEQSTLLLAHSRLFFVCYFWCGHVTTGRLIRSPYHRTHPR